MKIVAIVANVILLVIAILVTIDESDHIGAEEIPVLAAFLITPVLSIIALWRSSPKNSGDRWLSLWLRRKTLEEKRKIEELSSK